jgi:hypothetical protein
MRNDERAWPYPTSLLGLSYAKRKMESITNRIANGQFFYVYSQRLLNPQKPYGQLGMVAQRSWKKCKSSGWTFSVMAVGLFVFFLFGRQMTAAYVFI